MVRSCPPSRTRRQVKWPDWVADTVVAGLWRSPARHCGRAKSSEDESPRSGCESATRLGAFGFGQYLNPRACCTTSGLIWLKAQRDSLDGEEPERREIYRRARLSGREPSIGICPRPLTSGGQGAAFMWGKWKRPARGAPAVLSDISHNGQIVKLAMPSPRPAL